MNDYLNKLDKALKNVDKQVKMEILSDYKEHFELGFEAGKSKEHIIESLGDPDEIAKMYAALGALDKAHKTKRPKDIIRMILAVISYKVVGGLLIAALYFTAISFMITLFASAVGIIIAGLGCAAYGVYMFVLSYAHYALLGVFAFIVLTSGGVLSLIGCKKLWKATVGNISGIARSVMFRKTAIGDVF